MRSASLIVVVVLSLLSQWTLPLRSENVTVETHIPGYPIHTIYLHCHNESSPVTLDPGDTFTWQAPWYNRTESKDLISIFSTVNASGFSQNESLEWRFSAPPLLYESSVKLFPNATLSISPMRGAFMGKWHCFRNSAEGVPESLLRIVSVDPETFIMQQYITSLIVGLTSLGGALVIGIFVGTGRYVYENKCSKQRKPGAFIGVIPVPFEEDEAAVASQPHATISIPSQTAEALLADTVDSMDRGENGNRISGTMTSSLDDSSSLEGSSSSRHLNADVDLVFMDEQVAEEYQQVLDSLAQSQNDPTRFSERMEELRARLRCDVGRRVKIMRSRMSRAVQRMGSQSALAAQRMRHGFATSVYAMKDQMRSVAELCGSVHVGQTISIVSITKQADGEEKETVLKNYTFG